VFETNSSSSHSVVISDGIDYIDVGQLDNPLTIESGEYGWGYEELRDWKSIVSYAYTYAANNGRQDDLNMLKRVVEDYTGVEVIFAVSTDMYYPTGYIDHQSIEVAEEMFKNEEILKKAIFGTGSYIIIDNDNH
jgi:hypothetical protein